MGDLTSPRVLWVKFGLFLMLGALAGAIALVLFPSWRLAALMAIAVWAFCRAYYFAFYLIQRYIDPRYRFAGLGSLVVYALRQGKGPRNGG
jgi:hypothetical protein